MISFDKIGFSKATGSKERSRRYEVTNEEEDDLVAHEEIQLEEKEEEPKD